MQSKNHIFEHFNSSNSKIQDWSNTKGKREYEERELSNQIIRRRNMEILPSQSLS